MSHQTKEVFEDLDEVLGGLRFSHLHSDGKSGRYWSVYVHPFLEAQESGFDAFFVISARVPDLAMGGWRIVVRALEGGGEWRSETATNARGEVFVKGLPEGEFSAALSLEP
jgi:hypothetical protein